MLRFGEWSDDEPSSPRLRTSTIYIVPSDGSGDKILSGRKVRCPKCKIIVPVPPDFTFYRCRSCYVYLQAENEVPASEISPEQNVAEEHKQNQKWSLDYSAARTEEGNLGKSSTKLDEPAAGTKSGNHGQTKYELDEPGNQYVGNKQPEPSSSQADPNLERKGPRFMTPIRSPVRRSPFTTPPQPKEPNTIGFITSLFKKKRQIDTNLRQPAQPAVQDKTVHLPEEKILESSRSDPAEESPQEEDQPMSFGLATVFRYQELKAATDCFHQSRELGGGGFGKVYLGKLSDGRTVAVKKLYDDNPKQLEQFFNEVTVLSRVRHQNLVALFGCTNPSSRKKLLLVYEFVPNGTVADHLFGQWPALSWDVRVLIATETAAALAYLHSLEPPIIHRDVKTSNILLDNNFHVKVADLGICRLLPWDTTYVSTAPQGTMGYRDPDYDVYCKLTDKSDVYSFGVVLLELISGEQAVDVNRDLSDIYLTKMAMNKILNNELEMLVDPKLGYHTDCDIKRMINLVAELACNCLEQEGSKRPSMVEVLMTLKAIRDGTQPAQNKLTDINHADDVVRQQENVQLSLDG